MFCNFFRLTFFLDEKSNNPPYGGHYHPASRFFMPSATLKKLVFKIRDLIRK